MKDDIRQMRALIDRLVSTANNLDFTLKIALDRDTHSEELLEDINFDVEDILMFTRAMKDAWNNVRV